MSLPAIRTPHKQYITPLLSLETAAMSCPPSAAHGGVSLLDPLSKISLFNKPLMSLALSLSSLVLRLGNYKTYQPSGCSPTV